MCISKTVGCCPSRRSPVRSSWPSTWCSASGILPLVGAFHLKFWDLDDADGRVSAPIRDLGAVLAGSDFAGTLCSEWGGHEWLDADAADMTRRHLALARSALADGVAAA